MEELTGLYRRTNEVVAVPLDKLGGNSQGFRVTDASGDEQPWQAGHGELLFPVSLMPGELPEYHVYCCGTEPSQGFENQITLRKVGMRRVELGNSRFRVVIDTGAAAIIEAYNLSAGPQRVLNLVETTPEDPRALREDMYAESAKVPPPTGVGGENTGWTSLGGTGEFTSVKFLETGPLRGRVRLERDGETWELVWTAGSAALRWKARRGFRFASVSASPYLPFDRFTGGAEDWPAGPGKDEPPDHEIGPRKWAKLPGGHVVYYRKGENHGALGIIALDPELDWRGVGSRRFEAAKANGESEIAITFPIWRDNETALEARKENQLLRQPLLVQAAGPEEARLQLRGAAAREPHYVVRKGAGPPAAFRPEQLSLDGDWELAFGEKGGGPASEWRTVRVPGSAHTQWLDPSKWYTREANWISAKEWWYRKRFVVPARWSSKRLRLQFDATDYYADAYLNGAWLGRHEGYMDPYEYEVSNETRCGSENELLVRVWTPVTYYWRHRPYTVKGSYGAVDQKPDDITATGITRSVRLVASAGPVIRDVAVDTRLAGQGAEVEIQLEADRADGSHQWLLALSPRNFSEPATVYTVRAPLKRRSARFVLLVENPQLWWTWDHGRPNLYTLDVRILDAAGKPLDGRSLAVGIREIEKTGWMFHLNRRRMFIRGTNYYYNLFLSQMNRPAYERDLDLMLRMNVNMIRLHCHFTNSEFYDLADEQGVLIWQDYLEAWYPHDTEFSRRAAALYDAHIRYVRNHPSVAIWATSDEEDLDNYVDLTKHLAPRLFLHDPQRRAVIRSTGRYGDAHLYHGWYGGSIWEYARMEEQFVSELGAPSLPTFESLIKFLPNHWPIRDHADEWKFRKLQIAEAMAAWGEPGNVTLQEYIPRTQSYAARLFQLAIERMRRRKYKAGGILHFHAIDIWPSVTMAAVDFYRMPTKVFDTVRRSFAPVLVSFEYPRDQWRVGEEFRCGVWAVNDQWNDIPDATVSWQLIDSKGRIVLAGQFLLTIPPDSAQKIAEVRWIPTEPGDLQLRAQVRRAMESLSENLFEFRVRANDPK